MVTKLYPYIGLSYIYNIIPIKLVPLTKLNLSLISYAGVSKSGYSTIYLNILNETLDINYSFCTPFTIEENQWDNKKQRPSNIYLKKYKALNCSLNDTKIKVIKIIKERQNQNKPIKHNIISREIKKIFKDNGNDFLPETTLLYHMKLYIDTKKELITKSTYKRYLVFYRLIHRFEGFALKRLEVSNVGLEFINEFSNFAKIEEYSENTIHRTINFVKTILNFAEKKGIRTQIRLMETRKEKQYREIITLSEKEILKIEKTSVPQELQQAKDWLLISCYTGQRVSDFMNFSKNQLLEINNNTCISFIQKKTGKQITLPLHPIVLKIIRHNGGFPKSMRLDDYNRSIKRVAKIVGLKEEIYSYKRVGYRIRKISQEKWEAISSHIGRRSFATNFYGKIPTSLLMEATGHTTEIMFKRYVNVADHDKITRLSKYFEKVYQENLLTISD